VANNGTRPSGIGAALGTSKQQLEDAFTKQDEAVLAYLEGVTNPWTDAQVRVPLVVGGFALETDTFQMVYEGEAVAGTNGIAYVVCGASGWVPTGNSGLPAEQFESYNGGTQGNPIFASANSAAGATGFPSNGTVASAIHVATPSRLVEAAWNGSSRVRVASVGLEVFSDAATQNAAGKIMICSTVRPEETSTPSTGGISGNTFGQIVTTPRKELERAEMPLAGWQSGQVLRAYGVPAEPTCFEMNQMPAAGTTGAPFGIIGAIAQGMVAGQSFAWRAVYNYEAITEVSNKTSTDGAKVVHAGLDRITNAVPNVKAFAAVGGPAPAITALPIATHALANEMVLTRPSHANALIEMGKRPALAAQHPSISDKAKSILNKVADSGWLAKVPFVGTIADAVAKGASSIWNMF